MLFLFLRLLKREVQRTIDLVAQDQERRLAQVLHREQGVELVFALLEPVWVFGVDEEHDAGHFREVVFP